MTSAVSELAIPETMVEPPAEMTRGLVGRLVRKPVAIICLCWLSLVLVVAIIGPTLLPHVNSQDAGNLLAANQGPSSAHLLGTDTLGRDVLQRLVVGTQATMLGVGEALIVGVLLGTSLGIAAGYFGGWLDWLVSSLADIAFSVPSIIIVLVVLSVFPDNMLAAMVTLGALGSPGLMRVVRGVTKPVRGQLYVEAATVSGLTPTYILIRHVLPRIRGTIIVQASLLAAIALLVQSGLAFLGLLLPEPQPSWGGMIADGASVLLQNSWLLWPPGLAIMLTAVAFGLLGDSLRDAAVEGWSSSAAAAPSRRQRRPTILARRADRGSRAAMHPSSEPAEGDSGSVLLDVSDLTVSLDRGDKLTPIVQNVSFRIEPGETVGLVGESGSGKSITAAAILGLLPGGTRLDAGSVHFGGRDLTAGDGGRTVRMVRGKEIGFISQEPMVALDPAFRVGAQLAETVRRHHHVSRAAAKARVRDLLSSVQLPRPEEVAQRYPHELSGGMAQRVAIARALAGQPRLLIADEPSTALDVTTQAEILELLRQLQAENGMAVLLITHDWGVIAEVCDRAVIMYAGQVVEQASTAAIFRAPLHPYTRALLRANPHNVTVGAELPVIPGTVPRPGAWPQGCHFHPRCEFATDDCRAEPIELHELDGGRLARCIRIDEVVGK